MESIAPIIVKKVDNDEEVNVGSFWADGTCLIFMLRRFGCQICRWQAKQMSELAPQLKERKVRLIAVGPEKFGWEEFVQGNFWDGEVYYDQDKKLYNDLGMKRSGVMSLIGGFFKKATWDAVSKSKEKGVSGNLKGDVYQLGGLLVIDKMGNKLYEFHQDDFSQHPDITAVAKCLGIEFVPSVDNQSPPICNSESCNLPTAAAGATSEVAAKE